MSEFGLPGPGPAAAWRPSRPAGILVGLVGAAKRREARRGGWGRLEGAPAGVPRLRNGRPAGRIGPGVPGLLFPSSGRGACGSDAEPVPKGLFSLPPARRMRIVDDDDVSWKSRPAGEGQEEEEEGDESDLPVVSGGRPGPLLAGCLQTVMTRTCGPSPDAKPKRSEEVSTPGVETV